MSHQGRRQCQPHLVLGGSRHQQPGWADDAWRRCGRDRSPVILFAEVTDQVALLESLIADGAGFPQPANDFRCAGFQDQFKGPQPGRFPQPQGIKDRNLDALPHSEPVGHSVPQDNVTKTKPGFRRRHIGNLGPRRIKRLTPDDLGPALRIQSDRMCAQLKVHFVISRRTLQSDLPPRLASLGPLGQSRGGDAQVPPSTFIFRIEFDGLPVGFQAIVPTPVQLADHAQVESRSIPIRVPTDGTPIPAGGSRRSAAVVEGYANPIAGPGNGANVRHGRDFPRLTLEPV